MYEMTLSGLMHLGKSAYGTEDAKFMYVLVSMDGQAPEMIINPKENFASKLNYYQSAYNQDLTLKTNPLIQIVGYDFTEEFPVLTGLQ